MFKLNQSKGYRSTRNKTAIVDILVMSGRLIIRKQQLEKGDFELQEGNDKTSCKWIHDSCCKSKSDLLL
jgi:hypothetical protein